MSESKQRPLRPVVSASTEAFLTGTPHVAAFTTLRPDGSLHVAPVRFTYDAPCGLARVLTVISSRKARNLLAAPGSRVALCQVQDFTWVSLEGTGTVVEDPARIAEGVKRYARRYWSAPPSPPGRVVIEIEVERILSLNT